MRKPLTLVVSIGFAFCALVVAQPALAGGPQGPITDNVCIYGFSKSWCDGSVRGGDWDVFTCPDCPDRAVLKGFGALFDGQLTAGTGTCMGPDGQRGACDDAKDLAGALRATVDFNALRGAACPGRGSWGGTWTLFDGTVFPPLRATGRIDATVGVGTHRVNECQFASCGPNCELCYNATFTDATSIWVLHNEGFLEGEVLAGHFEGCRIRASLQGKVEANGDVFGPLPPNDEWFNSCFTLDGVLECPCSTGF